MALRTRKPTGKPSWPIALVAGVEKAGKSWACAEASASDMIGRTLWVGIGEDDPDEYGAIPGSDFEIVEHDGTYRGILGAIRAAVAEPVPEHGKLLLVVDSMTRLWDLIKDDAQATANARAARKGRRGTQDAQITMDLWNRAADQWGAVMSAIRAHQGPVLLTARLDQVTVMDSNGKPTAEKSWKVNGHKSLPYDVGAVIELPARGEALLRGVRSAKLQIAEPTKLSDFTVENLWKSLGLADGTSERAHSGVVSRDPESEPSRDWGKAISDAKTIQGLNVVWSECSEAGEVTDDIKSAFASRGAKLKAVTKDAA